jgi:SAM-dependent methyltransferase
MWAVLEHVWRPREYIEKAASLLKPGGRLIVLVTNLNSIQGRIYRQDDYPRHLTIFTKNSLRRLYGSIGLSTHRVWTDQKIFGGSLYGGLVYMTKRLLGYTPDEVYYEWRGSEGSLFFSKFRGKNSLFIKTVSRIDRLVTLLPERLLDRMGYGAIVMLEAEKAFNV